MPLRHDQRLGPDGFPDGLPPCGCNDITKTRKETIAKHDGRMEVSLCEHGYVVTYMYMSGVVLALYATNETLGSMFTGLAEALNADDPHAAWSGQLAYLGEVYGAEVQQRLLEFCNAVLAVEHKTIQLPNS